MLRLASDKWICTFLFPERSQTNGYAHSCFQRGLGQMDMHILVSREVSDKWICTFLFPERSRINGFAYSCFQRGLGQMNITKSLTRVRNFQFSITHYLSFGESQFKLRKVFSRVKHLKSKV